MYCPVFTLINQNVAFWRRLVACNVDPGNEREIDAEEIRLKERHAIGRSYGVRYAPASTGHAEGHCLSGSLIGAH